MVFFRGPPLDVSFLAYTHLVVRSELARAIAAEKNKKRRKKRYSRKK